MSDAERFRVDEIEYVLIGAAMTDMAAMANARALVSPDSFGFPAHRSIWSVMCDQFDSGRPIDLVSIRAILRQRNAIGAVETNVRLGPLPYMPAPSDHVAEWAGRVSANGRARATYRALHRGLALADDPELTAEVFCASAREAVSRAADEGDDAGESWLDDDIDELQRRLEDAEKNGPVSQGLTTGLEDLDRLVGGLRGGQVYVLAGRTSTGKTALAGSIAIGMALLGQDPSLFVSLEMTAEDMAGRAMAYLAEVPQSRIRSGTERPLTEAELEETNKVSASVRKRVRLLSGDVTIRDIRTRARHMKHTHGLSMVIVDYLQLVSPEKTTKGSREREVAEVSRGLKRLSIELKVPVIALSQLNRDADDRERPRLKDLRESGAVEQDATAVVFLWPTDDPDKIQLIVEKSRFGALGETTAHFDRPTTRFSPLAAEDMPPAPAPPDGISAYEKAMRAGRKGDSNRNGRGRKTR